jgi:hypothetical protein
MCERYGVPPELKPPALFWMVNAPGTNSETISREFTIKLLIMGKLFEAAKLKAAEVKTMEIDIVPVVIAAMIPMPDGDLYVKDVVAADDSVTKSYKPKQLIDPAELAEYKFFAKNYMMKYQEAGTKGEPTGKILTDFVTENKIINPLTVYSDVKANITFNGYTKKDGTEGVGILSITCSTENTEYQLKNFSGAWRK